MEATFAKNLRLQFRANSDNHFKSWERPRETDDSLFETRDQGYTHSQWATSARVGESLSPA